MQQLLAEIRFLVKAGPPGPPPRPGLKWRARTHRWVCSEEGCAVSHDHSLDSPEANIKLPSEAFPKGVQVKISSKAKTKMKGEVGQVIGHWDETNDVAILIDGKKYRIRISNLESAEGKSRMRYEDLIKVHLEGQDDTGNCAALCAAKLLNDDPEILSQKFNEEIDSLPDYLERAGYELTWEGDARIEDVTLPERGLLWGWESGGDLYAVTIIDGVLYDSYGDNAKGYVVSEMYTPKLPISNNKETGYLDYDQVLKPVGGQKGSQPGGVYQNSETGAKSYVKFIGPDRAKTEALAASLYEAAGIKIPKVSTIEFKGQVALKSDWLEGIQPMSIAAMRSSPEVREGFVVDAWLANWDVVGTGADNIGEVNGTPYRVDAGGSLLFRAQGGPKKFDAKVPELETMRDPDISWEGSKVFGSIKPAELQAGAQKVVNISDSQIEQLVEQSGLPAGPIPEYPHTDNVKQFLIDRLKARRNTIGKRFGVTAS